MIFARIFNKIKVIFICLFLSIILSNNAEATSPIKIATSYDDRFNGVEHGDVDTICQIVVNLVLDDTIKYTNASIEKISSGIVSINDMRNAANTEIGYNYGKEYNSKYSVLSQQQLETLKKNAENEIARNKQIDKTAQTLKSKADAEIEKNKAIQKETNRLKELAEKEVEENNKKIAFKSSSAYREEEQTLKNYANTYGSNYVSYDSNGNEVITDYVAMYNQFLNNFNTSAVAQYNYENYIKTNKVSNTAQDEYNNFIQNNPKSTIAQDAYNNALNQLKESNEKQETYTDYISKIVSRNQSSPNCNYYYNYICINKLIPKVNNKFLLIQFANTNKFHGYKYYCDINDDYDDTVDRTTSNSSSSSNDGLGSSTTTSNGAVYYVHGIADDIYTVSENNGIADAICRAIDIATQLMVPLFAIMFSVVGLKAYQGKLEWSMFVTFAIAIAAFKGAGTILEFFLPDMGLQYGCKCATVRYIRDTNGLVKRYSTGLTEDCKDAAVVGS